MVKQDCQAQAKSLLILLQVLFVSASLCSFSVCNEEVKGSGFVFLQNQWIGSLNTHNQT